MNQSFKIWLFAGAFVVLSPISISSTASAALKYLRLFSTVVAFYLAYRSQIFTNKQSTTKSLYNFAILFTLAAIWTQDNVEWALFNKGMFFLTLMTGIAMAYSVESNVELLKKLHGLGLVGGCSGLSLGYMFLSNPEDNMVNDRLSVAGMNANTIGAAAAPLFLLSVFLTFKPSSKFLKTVHMSSAIILLAIVVATGSRGAVLMSALGAIFILKPILKKNFFSALMALLIPVMVFQMFTAVSGDDGASTPGFDRITSEEKKENTRSGMWNWTWRRFKESPMIGEGWLHWGKNSVNTHNIYLQVLAECGIIGGAFFAIFLIQTFATYRSNMQSIKLGYDKMEFSYFSSGLIASMLLHGMVESSTLLGTTTNSLFLGFAIGLLDRSISLENPDAIEDEDQSDLHPWAFQRKLPSEDAQEIPQ